MKTIKVINLLFYFPLSIWRQLRNSFCKNGHQEPLGPIIETLVVFAVQITFGYLRDFLVYAGVLRNRNGPFERNREGYVPLYNDFENFYRRNIFRPISFVIGQPIASIPGPTVQIVERYSDDYNRSYKVTNSKKTLINMVSYNYLNMNQSDGPVSDSVQRKIITRSVGLGTSRHELGQLKHSYNISKTRFIYRNYGHTSRDGISHGWIPASGRRADSCHGICYKHDSHSRTFGCRQPRFE